MLRHRLSCSTCLLLALGIALPAGADEGATPGAAGGQFRSKVIAPFKTKARVQQYKQQAVVGARLDQRVEGALGFRPRGLPSARALMVGARQASKRMSRNAPLEGILLTSVPGEPRQHAMMVGDGWDTVTTKVTPHEARRGIQRTADQGLRHSLRAVLSPTSKEPSPVGAPYNREVWTAVRGTTSSAGQTRSLTRHFRRVKGGLVLEVAMYNGQSHTGQPNQVNYLHSADGKRRRISYQERNRLWYDNQQLTPQTKQWSKQQLQAAGVQLVTIGKGKHAGQSYFRRGPNFDADKARAMGLSFVRGHQTRRGYRRAHLRTTRR